MPHRTPVTPSTPGLSTRWASAPGSAVVASTTTRASTCESWRVRCDETFSVQDHAVVDVELPAGSVLVRTGASGTVALSIDSSNAEHIEVAQVGDDISIRATRRGRSARIAIDVPIGTDVNVRGA